MQVIIFPINFSFIWDCKKYYRLFNFFLICLFSQTNIRGKKPLKTEPFIFWGKSHKKCILFFLLCERIFLFSWIYFFINDSHFFFIETSLQIMQFFSLLPFVVVKLCKRLINSNAKYSSNIFAFVHFKSSSQLHLHILKVMSAALFVSGYEAYWKTTVH